VLEGGGRKLPLLDEKKGKEEKIEITASIRKGLSLWVSFGLAGLEKGGSSIRRHVLAEDGEGREGSLFSSLHSRTSTKGTTAKSEKEGRGKLAYVSLEIPPLTLSKQEGEDYGLYHTGGGGSVLNKKKRSKNV